MSDEKIDVIEYLSSAETKAELVAVTAAKAQLQADLNTLVAEVGMPAENGRYIDPALDALHMVRMVLPMVPLRDDVRPFAVVVVEAIEKFLHAIGG